MIILRTHGGLGNQIFQVLYARLYSDQNGTELGEVHDSSYNHHFPRSLELIKRNAELSYFQRFISSLRLPKLLNRIGFYKVETFSVFGSTFLDGYFQTTTQYRSFDSKKITRELIRIRDELKIQNTKKKKLLIHLRLGDFFESVEEAKKFALTRLLELPLGATIITNQENLLADPELKSLLDIADCKVLTTVGFTSEEVIRLMSSFETIITNDSTLTFWAAVLGCCNVDFKNPSLSELFYYFKKLLIIMEN